MQQEKTKRLVVLGAGESGVGAAVLGKARNWDVFVSDVGTIAPKYKEEMEREGIAYEEGGHTAEKILNADMCVKSPGIPLSAPLVVQLQSRGIEVVSEIEFAGRYSTAPMLCITGSNGKTTTTTLVSEILRHAGYTVHLGGNIGTPLLPRVSEMKPEDLAVVELSSFQLMGMKHSPHVAAITNLTPNHLDYHKDFDEYVQAKTAISCQQPRMVQRGVLSCV